MIDEFHISYLCCKFRLGKLKVQEPYKNQVRREREMNSFLISQSYFAEILSQEIYNKIGRDNRDKNKIEITQTEIR